MSRSDGSVGEASSTRGSGSMAKFPGQHVVNHCSLVSDLCWPIFFWIYPGDISFMFDHARSRAHLLLAEGRTSSLVLGLSVLLCGVEHSLR